MRQTGLVSVIIPARNAEKTLQAAVRSVCDQNYPYWELCIVENGSTDATSTLAEQLAAADGRIRVLHSPQGVSRARNLGINAALGRWLTFLDADDRLAPGALRLLADTAHARQADLVTGLRLGDGRAATRPAAVFSEKKPIEQLLRTFMHNATQNMTVWGKLFAVDTIRNQHIFFDEHLTHAEDSDFCMRFIFSCKTVVQVFNAIYEYNTSSDSTVRCYISDLTNRYLLALKTSQRFIQSACPQLDTAFAAYGVTHLLLSLTHGVCNPQNGLNRAQRLREMERVVSLPLFASAIRKAELAGLPGQQQLALLLLKCRSLTLLDMLVQLRRRKNNRKAA